MNLGWFLACVLSDAKLPPASSVPNAESWKAGSGWPWDCALPGQSFWEDPWHLSMASLQERCTLHAFTLRWGLCETWCAHLGYWLTGSQRLLRANVMHTVKVKRPHVRHLWFPVSSVNLSTRIKSNVTDWMFCLQAESFQVEARIDFSPLP